MAAWDDVIDFDVVGHWPMELTGWLRLLEAPSAQEQRARVEQLVREYLQVSRIRTYHCTRFLASEVEAIKREGLRPPSADLARDKREAASAAGRPLPFWAQDNPSDKIWFYHRRADLDAAIAGSLLRSWGGKELLATSRGVVDSAAQPYIIAFDYPVKELKYVFAIPVSPGDEGHQPIPGPILVRCAGRYSVRKLYRHIGADRGKKHHPRS